MIYFIAEIVIIIAYLFFGGKCSHTAIDEILILLFVLFDFTYRGLIRASTLNYCCDSPKIKNRGVFKRVKVNSFFKHILFGNDFVDGMCLASICVQIYIFLIDAFCLLCSIVYFARPIAKINIDMDRWQLLFLSLVIIVLLSGAVYRIFILIVDTRIAASKEKSIKSLFWESGDKSASEYKNRHFNYRKFMKEAKWHEDLKRNMKKYCYHKYRGQYYIPEDDLDEIQSMILTNYPNAEVTLVSNEKGKTHVTVYSKNTNTLLFEAPLNNKA
jgi:hypothetical protein